MVIFGYNIDKDIKGIEKLNDEDIFVKKGIYSILNGIGLENREKYLVYKVEKEINKFKLCTKNEYM